MKEKLPGPVITVVANVLGSYHSSHRHLDLLFSEKGAIGDPPACNCIDKCAAWFKRSNEDDHADAFALMGAVLEDFMEVDSFGRTDEQADGRRRISEILSRYNLSYQTGGRIVGARTATPTRTLETILRSRNVDALDTEMRRALENVERDPAATLTAACALLESFFKVYIEDEKLSMPADRSMMPLWKVVRDHLGLDPKLVEDEDLKKILQGLASIADGIGCARTHMGSAHGKGRRQYAVRPRHARLAAHSAHTLALFLFETWDARRSAGARPATT
jgi:hypothetical protein